MTPIIDPERNFDNLNFLDYDLDALNKKRSGLVDKDTKREFVHVVCIWKDHVDKFNQWRDDNGLQKRFLILKLGDPESEYRRRITDAHANIGYMRRFLQKFAAHFRIPRFWMVDQDIHRVCVKPFSLY